MHAQKTADSRLFIFSRRNDPKTFNGLLKPINKNTMIR